jgi:acylphosphatase
VRRHYWVAGSVQGVGFRYFARSQAARLGLSGWVRNHPDGEVEVLAEGKAEQLLAFETQLRRGPRMASVTTVRTQEISDQSEELSSFEIR